MVVYSIKDLEKLSGVKAHTLRIWEKRYDILQPKRTPTNIRYYLDDDLRLILNIALLNRNGIKISKIAKMERDQIQRKVAELTEVDESFEGQLDSLTISLIELDEDKFDRLLSKNIEQLGFEHTMMEVVYPLLDKLAMMWMAGSIKSIHEKFVIEIIRRKNISEINKLKITKDQRFLIYLPEGETNELSLLFLHYLIRKEGFKVINVGSDIGLPALADANSFCTVDYVFTIINEPVKAKNIGTYIDTLKKDFPESKIILSGLQTMDVIISEDDGQVRIMNSSDDTIRFLKNIQVN